MPTRYTVGEVIQRQRKVRNLSQLQLAQKAGVEHTKLHRIESGQTRHPDPIVLGKVADVLGTSVELYYAAAGFPLPHHDMYGEPMEFFYRLYGLRGTVENLPEIEKRVEEHYSRWLKHLADYTQEEIDFERGRGLSNVPHPWPLARGELALYQLLRLRQQLGVAT